MRGLDERIPPVIDLPITYINRTIFQDAACRDYASVPLSRVPSGERERERERYGRLDAGGRAVATAAATAPQDVKLSNPRRDPRRRR